MPTPYTSARNGLWDASDVDTWGQGIGVYPNTAADVVNIGHTVTYNKVLTVEFGQININSSGILTFSTTMSTKLTLAHQDILINSGGELRVGASGAVIPAAYTAEILWATTTDNAKGISGAGTLNVYGDPSFYGSKLFTYLGANWSAPASGASSFTADQDVSALWAAGQQLMVHKGLGYASYINDWCLCTITSISGTTINVTMDHIPGGAATFYAGGLVVNLSRNVKLGKLSPNTNLGQFNTLRPRIACTTAQFTISNAVLTAISGLTGPKILSGTVVRNSGGVVSDYDYFTSGSNIIAAICNAALAVANFDIDGLLLVGNNYAVQTPQAGIIRNAQICGNNQALWPRGVTFKDCYIYSHTYDIWEGDGIFDGCQFGFSPKLSNLAVVLRFPTHLRMRNCKFSSSLTLSSRARSGRISSECHNQAAGAHYIYDGYGDIVKTPADGTGDNPTQRTGGNADVLEVIPQSTVTTDIYCEILSIRLWAAASVSKTYRFYIQTDYVTLPTAELKLYGEYLDQATGGRVAIVSSTQGITTRTNASDWSQYVEVTMNPAQEGWVNLYLRLMGYESGKKVWVDPKGVIT